MKMITDIGKLPAEPYRPLAEISRTASAQGSVLLKNKGGTLPLSKNDKFSLFGRTQIDYIKSGTGSGGLVRVDYVVNILDGIRNNADLSLNEELVEVYKHWLVDHPFDLGPGWAQEPWSQLEMVPDEKTVSDARKVSDVAIIVLGRTAGEDRDNSADKGSWYLTDEEEALLDIVSKHFDKTVVLLNVGNIIDMKWVEKYDIKSVMYIWQGGQEGGNAVADLLSGKETPCGKLTDTIASDISLYPAVKNFGNKDFNIYEEDIYVGYRYFETFAKEEVLYPFGFGLSYTTFEYSNVKVSESNRVIRIDADIINTGDYSGREIVQVYFEAPQGLLGKSTRELCGFTKTKLLAPGESETVTINVNVNDMCAYDDSGITGNKSCYVLENGVYNIYVGCCVRCAKKEFSYNVAETIVVKKCTEALSPVRKFNVMHPIYENGKYTVSYKPVSERTIDYRGRIASQMPKEIEYTGDCGIKLADVKSGKNTIEEFTAQLADIDLICLARGEGMCSPKVRPGSAGAIGGVTESLSNFGVPIVALHDGPSGIRLDSGEHATSLPNGTAIACTWDVELAQDIYSLLSIELCTHSIDSILGPGINIHRLPLNGRNFEYLSEDPYLSGKIAAALVRGIATYGNSATIKHFAANSQEYFRRDVDSVMSERAAREIYLKSFEYAVKDGHPTSLMTSYNPINGIWSANNYELCTLVLREEWGYDGLIMTDWWPKLSHEENEYMNLANMVEAQNDVYMPTPDALSYKDNIPSSLESGALSRGQLQRNAMNILKYISNSHALERFIKFGGKLEKSLADSLDTLNEVGEVATPETTTVYNIKVSTPGNYLVGIEYCSSEPSISQMCIGLFIDEKSAASLTVNGTDGQKKIIYRDISVVNCDMKLSVTFPDKLVTVTKISILK